MWETRTGRKLPPYVADSAGRPLLSWRVLVLPELDRTPLFNLFHLDEPWDSPHNRPLAARIEQFICPLSQVGQQKSSPLTNYLAVTGEGTFWSGDEPASSSVSAGQPDAGMLIVECNQSAVVWSEPRDLDVSQLQFRYTSTMSPGLSSKHANRAVNVALNDMTVIPISPQEYDAEALGDFAYRLGSPQRPEKHSLRWREWMNR